MPQVQPYETIAPVLRLQVQEDIVPVLRVILQEIVCDVPGPQFRTVEKVMEVPIIIIKSEEVVVEKRVPKSIVAWVEKVMEVEQVVHEELVEVERINEDVDVPVYDYIDGENALDVDVLQECVIDQLRVREVARPAPRVMFQDVARQVPVSRV